MKNTQASKGAVIIYRPKGGGVDIKVKLDNETVWLDAHQIGKVFGVDRTGVVRHIQNIYKTRELLQNSTCAKIAQVAKDGKTRQIDFYNLDMIISVGYRVNSRRATQFRIWATKTLQQYITQGYAINKNRIAENYGQFLDAVENIKALLPEGGGIDPESALELIKAFAATWVSLEAYDEDKLATSGVTKRSVAITAEQLAQALREFKKELLQNEQATDLFCTERQKESIAGIVGNVMQSFGGKSVYPTVEEKAAHLLYFVVKNHPFLDGNKRSGAYSFVWFLKKARVLDVSKITPPALTALTLFIAESDPKNKDRMIRLVLQLLRK